MDQLHRSADKLTIDVKHLEKLLRSDAGDSTEQAELALSIAKRVRRESTILVRHLAALRDKLQP